MWTWDVDYWKHSLTEDLRAYKTSHVYDECRTNDQVWCQRSACLTSLLRCVGLGGFKPKICCGKVVKMHVTWNKVPSSLIADGIILFQCSQGPGHGYVASQRYSAHLGLLLGYMLFGPGYMRAGSPPGQTSPSSMWVMWLPCQEHAPTASAPEIWVAAGQSHSLYPDWKNQVVPVKG